MMLAPLFLLAVLTAPQDAPKAAFARGAAERLVEGLKFAEGPVWVPGQGLLFSDIPADTIYRADKSVFRSPSGNANGLAIDRQGRLLACEHGNRRVSLTETDGTVTTLADTYLGKRLNSPNDLVVRSDGTIFFTDPPYGVDESRRELPFCGVYAIKPDRSLVLLSVYFSHPNGIGLSPDEKILYVTDSQANFIQAYDILDSGALANSRLFCRCDNPDGMKVDAEGNVWAATSRGIQIFDPAGTEVGLIDVPEHPSNCAFGDENGQTLYVTARSGLYKIVLE